MATHLRLPLVVRMQSERFDLLAFVFMPEHVHLLVLPEDVESRVSRFLSLTKQPSSKAIRRLLQSNGSPLLESLTVDERPGKRCVRFWQEGPGYDRNLFSGPAIQASIDYNHANPVKRRLCRSATDWRWSSARFYQRNEQNADLPTLVRPDSTWFHAAGVQREHA